MPTSNDVEKYEQEYKRYQEEKRIKDEYIFNKIIGIAFIVPVIGLLIYLIVFGY